MSPPRANEVPPPLVSLLCRTTSRSAAPTPGSSFVPIAQKACLKGSLETQQQCQSPKSRRSPLTPPPAPKLSYVPEPDFSELDDDVVPDFDLGPSLFETEETQEGSNLFTTTTTSPDGLLFCGKIIDARDAWGIPTSLPPAAPKFTFAAYPLEAEVLGEDLPFLNNNSDDDVVITDSNDADEGDDCVAVLAAARAPAAPAPAAPSPRDTALVVPSAPRLGPCPHPFDLEDIPPFMLDENDDDEDLAVIDRPLVEVAYYYTVADRGQKPGEQAGAQEGKAEEACRGAAAAAATFTEVEVELLSLEEAAANDADDEDECDNSDEVEGTGEEDEELEGAAEGCKASQQVGHHCTVQKTAQQQPQPQAKPTDASPCGRSAPPAAPRLRCLPPPDIVIPPLMLPPSIEDDDCDAFSLDSIVASSETSDVVAEFHGHLSEEVVVYEKHHHHHHHQLNSEDEEEEEEEEVEVGKFLSSTLTELSCDQRDLSAEDDAWLDVAVDTTTIIAPTPTPLFVTVFSTKECVSSWFVDLATLQKAGCLESYRRGIFLPNLTSDSGRLSPIALSTCSTCDSSPTQTSR